MIQILVNGVEIRPEKDRQELEEQLLSIPNSYTGFTACESCGENTWFHAELGIAVCTSCREIQWDKYKTGYALEDILRRTCSCGQHLDYSSDYGEGGRWFCPSCVKD